MQSCKSEMKGKIQAKAKRCICNDRTEVIRNKTVLGEKVYYRQDHHAHAALTEISCLVTDSAFSLDQQF